MPIRQSTLSTLRLRFAATARHQPSRHLKTKAKTMGSSRFSTFFTRQSTPSTTLCTSTSLFTRTFASHARDHWATQRSGQRATWLLIGLNTLVFGAWQYADFRHDRTLLQQLHDHATLSAANSAAGRYWTLVTSAFSHKDLPHFFFNMYMLHTFGTLACMVPGVGGAHILAAAVGSGVAGSFAWLYHLKQSKSTAARRQFGRAYVEHRTIALGASGAVMGLSAVATCLLPLVPMQMLFIPVGIPLFIWTGAYALIDGYYLDRGGTGIGHAAHLGGAAFGVAYYLLRLRRMGGVWYMLRRR